MPDRPSPEALWFLNNRATIVVPRADSADGLSAIEMRAPFDDAPPLHVHRDEDELLYIIAGELRFRVGDAVVTKRAGDTLLAPRGVPHGFRVLSPEGARYLVVMRGGFESLVRAVGRRPSDDGLPPPEVPPSAETQTRLGRECAALGIELLGPPID